MDATEAQIPYTHEFVVDAAYQRSLARALFAESFRRPWWWLLFAIFLLLLEGTFFWTIPWGVPVLWIVGVCGLAAFARVQTRRRIIAASPVGKVLKTGFGTDHFAVTDGDNASVVAYSGFDDVDVRRDVVWLRRRTPKGRVAFPRALFPDADVDRMRAGLAKPADPQLS